VISSFLLEHNQGGLTTKLAAMMGSGVVYAREVIIVQYKLSN
jgi:hypothetical protein